MSLSLRDLIRLDRSAFDPTIGVRAATFAVAPLAAALAFHDLELIFAALGAIFLINTEGQPSVLPSRVLLAGCFTEAASVCLGTISAMSGVLSPVFVGIAVSIALLSHGSAKWANAGTFTAVTFAVGAGIPGASLGAAWLRLYLFLFGSLFALLGVELHRFVASRRHPAPQIMQATPQALPPSEAVRSAVLLGVLSAVGFGVGLILGLPRDFWVVLTLVIAVRPTISLTLSFTSMMALGTVAGAVIAAIITLATSDIYVLLPLMFVFAVLMFASRGVNVGLVQIFLVPFIIILLNLIYPGEWYLALYRILEVGIGIGLALAAVYTLSEMKKG